MNLINSIVFATAILPSTVCVLAQVVRPDFTPGTCTFHGVVHRDCNSQGKMTTYFNLSPFYDYDGKQFMEQTNAIHLTDGLTLTGPVAGHQLHIAYVNDGMTFTYRDSHWPNNGKDSRFSCTTQRWVGEPLKQTQILSCNFKCEKPMANKRSVSKVFEA
ncbi:hypothetical protein CFE70_003131 [Pyrenophora teres f. teres 0-1]